MYRYNLGTDAPPATCMPAYATCALDALARAYVSTLKTPRPRNVRDDAGTVRYRRRHVACIRRVREHRSRQLSWRWTGVQRAPWQPSAWGLPVGCVCIVMWVAYYRSKRAHGMQRDREVQAPGTAPECFRLPLVRARVL